MKQSTTSADKFFNSEGNKCDKIFIKSKGNAVIGFLRVGLRKLFLSDGETNFMEYTTNCVLDFYVYHSLQKQGNGKLLFDKMLRFLNTQPYKLAYDTPNKKMLNFLYKHYSLNNVIKQNNSYIIFKEFFVVRRNI